MIHSARKQKLLWILLALTGFCLVVALVLYALKAQANYYYNPIDISTQNITENSTIRAGGLVVPGSVIRNPQDPIQVSFKITDKKAQVLVKYKGILPDLFKENAGVIVEGQLKNKAVYAQKVLAKHDENYMPPEVEKSLK